MNERDECWLFAYGTLCDPVVQRAVFDRELDSEADTLTGFRLDTVTIGGETYRTLRPAAGAGERIAGVVLRLAAADLRRADAYEGDTDYARISVLLDSGREAFVYVSAAD